MRIRTESGIGHNTVSLAGRFDAHEIAGFRSVVEALVGSEGSTLRIDLSNVLFVDSSALAELLRTKKSATAAGGGIVLVDVSDPVRIILELTDMTQVFDFESGTETTPSTS
jgi:anti-sigma B factor antagonist